MTTFIEPVPVGKQPYHYFVVRYQGDAIGWICLPNFGLKYGEDVMVGVRVLGKNKCEFDGPLSRAVLETYQEFELFPELVICDTKHTEIKTVSGGKVDGVQVTYKDPAEDYPMDNSITIPPGALQKLLK